MKHRFFYEDDTSLNSYIESCFQFWRDSQDWERLNPLKTYAADSSGGWYESSDAARGGIDVEWAAGCRGYKDRPKSGEEIREKAIHHFAEFWRLLSEEIKADED